MIVGSDAARQAAILEVRQLFRTPEQLQRLTAHSSEYERKRREASQQLVAALATEAQEQQRALDLLAASAASFQQVRQQLISIDSDCSQVFASIEHLDLLRRVNYGRKNVDASLRLMDKFKSLGVQCDQLLDELFEHDRHIRHVYLSLRRLMQLRDTAFDPTIAASFSPEFRQQLDESFQKLRDTADEFELRIWDNISDCTFLAKEDPTVVVRTLEVIEMEDRAARKIFLPPAHATGASSSSSNASRFFMRDKCLRTLEKSIADSFESLHKDEATVKKEKRMKEKEALIKAKLAEKKSKQSGKTASRAAEKKKKQEEQHNPFAADDEDETDQAEDELEDEADDLDMMAHDSEEMITNGVDSVLATLPDGDAKLSDYALEVLELMQDLVDGLDEITPDLAPCFPDDYEIVKFFEDRYKHWIKVTINFHTNDVSKLSKRALLKCVSWMSYYMSRTRELRFLSASDEAQWDALISDMMLQYTAATEATLTQLINNILRVEEKSEAELTPEGHYQTTGPADLFYTINQQMDIILNQYAFDSKPLGYVCFMLANVFTYYQNGQLEFLSRIELDPETHTLKFGADANGVGGIVKNDAFFCAVINNCELCRDNMDELKDKCLDKIRAAKTLPAPSHLRSTSSSASKAASALETMLQAFSSTPALVSKLQDVFDECGEGFISVASEAVDCLVLAISSTLVEPLDGLFTKDWLQDPEAINYLTDTLADFFTDYHAWLTREAYFARVVRLCLHTVTVEYLRRFLRGKLPLDAAFFTRFKQDQRVLDEFFMKYSKYVNEKTIAHELSSISVVQSLLQGDPDELVQNFHDKVHEIWKDKSVEVVESIISLRSDCTRVQKKQIVDQLTALVQEKVQREQRKGLQSAAFGLGGLKVATSPAASLPPFIISPIASPISPTAANSPPSSTRARRSLSGHSFVSPQSSFVAMFKARGKPDKKPKPSQREGRYKAAGEETMSLDEFLAVE